EATCDPQAAILFDGDDLRRACWISVPVERLEGDVVDTERILRAPNGKTGEINAPGHPVFDCTRRLDQCGGTGRPTHTDAGERYPQLELGVKLRQLGLA